MIKLALIGLGNMGGNHLKNIKALEKYNLCKLTCVCDIDKDKVNKAASENDIKGFNNIEDLISYNDFDAAIIATTSYTHFEISKKMLEKDKSVLVEKPVVISIKEAQELKSIADKSKGIISAGFTEVYNSVVSGLKECMEEDEKFSYIDFYRIGLNNSRNKVKDIDAIQDLLTHDLAVLSQVCDLNEVVDINGSVFNYNENSKKYDSSSVSLIFKNNSVVRFLVDRNSSVKKRELNISKTDLFGTFDYMDQTATVKEKGSMDAFGENIWYSQKYDTVQVRYANNPLLDEIKDFILAVENKGQTRVSEKWFEVTELVEKIREVIY